MEQQFDEYGRPIKKKFSIRIAGFEVGIKFFVLIGVLALVLLIVTIVNDRKKAKELEEAKARAEEARKNRPVINTERKEIDVQEEIQKSLVKKYGQAPEGFKWSVTGELVSTGGSDELNAEDIVYTYVRALSVLDFSTAGRYSSNSTVIDNYKAYYNSASNMINNYYNNFLRKQFKKSLTSLEITGVSDIAVFADGTKYVTLELNVLDLTNKAFWKKDKNNIFKELRYLKKKEEDKVKLEEYVYDYIYSKYEDESIGKRKVTAELVVSKDNGQGWLIEGDGELDAYLEYENGVDVAKYILDEFDTWNLQEDIKEQRVETEKRLKKVQKKVKKGGKK